MTVLLTDLSSVPSRFDCRSELDPAQLDRAADRALQWGLTREAEHLAHLAQAMREGTR
jgi:hypothetical protein